MQTKAQFLRIAMNLLDSAWPLEPIRQIQVKLLNLRDDKGNMSESALEVMNRTGGSLKLGGNPKDILPTTLIKVMKEEGVGLPPQLAGFNGPVQTGKIAKTPKGDPSDSSTLRPIIHHQIKPLFPEEQEAEEVKKQKMKEYFIKQNYQKQLYQRQQVTALRAGTEDQPKGPPYYNPYYNNQQRYPYNKWSNNGGYYKNNYKWGGNGGYYNKGGGYNKNWQKKPWQKREAPGAAE
jgi:hypothetical protein